LLFKRHHIKKILRGEKTQTRRVSQRKYKVGKVYGVRDRWYGQPKARILITRRFRQRLGDITEEDVRKEGYSSLEEFKKAWEEIHGVWDPEDIVWVYEFKNVNKDR